MSRIAYGRFVIEVVALDRLDLVEKNARFMKNEVLRRLVENIREDGQISQVPFCVPRGDRFVVLSGNHRVKAARLAGLSEIPIIYPTEHLTRDQELAIQLSHNAIVGEDDPVILKDLWEELTTVSAKLYSGLDDKALATLAAVTLPALAEVKLDFRTVSFLMLPEELESLQTVFDEARRQASAHVGYLARFADFDRLLDALATANAAHNIKNAATGLMCLVELTRRHLAELADGWCDPETGEARHDGWVPLSTVFGTDRVPAPVAAVVKRAVDRLVGEEALPADQRWRALEFLAADLLASPAAGEA